MYFQALLLIINVYASPRNKGRKSSLLSNLDAFDFDPFGKDDFDSYELEQSIGEDPDLNLKDWETATFDILPEIDKKLEKLTSRVLSSDAGSYAGFQVDTSSNGTSVSYKGNAQDKPSGFQVNITSARIYLPDEENNSTSTNKSESEFTISVRGNHVSINRTGVNQSESSNIKDSPYLFYNTTTNSSPVNYNVHNIKDKNGMTRSSSIVLHFPETLELPRKSSQPTPLGLRSFSSTVGTQVSPQYVIPYVENTSEGQVNNSFKENINSKTGMLSSCDHSVELTKVLSLLSNYVEKVRKNISEKAEDLKNRGDRYAEQSEVFRNKLKNVFNIFLKGTRPNDVSDLKTYATDILDVFDEYVQRVRKSISDEAESLRKASDHYVEESEATMDKVNDIFKQFLE